MGQRTIGLVEYGIMNEGSDYRAHVCIGSGTVELFPTEEGINAIRAHSYELKGGSQPGYSLNTYAGYAVPVADICGCECIPIPFDIFESVAVDKWSSTSAKGRESARIIKEMADRHLIRVPVKLEEQHELKAQIDGVDATTVIYGGHRIQVKCDYSGGRYGTKRLFLQTHECNPGKQY